MGKFSISAAWEETKGLLARDGRLFASVALALIVLPAVIAGVVDPRGPGEVEAPRWFDLVVLVISLISMGGQLALIRLALGPSITVAGAVSHGLGRLLPYIVALVILGLGAIILSIPFGMAAIAMGLNVEQGTIESVSAPVAMVLLAMVILFLFIAVRFLMIMPVASAERAGPFEMLKRSWALSDGHWLKLFLFLLVALFAAVLILVTVSMVAGSLILILFGSAEPMSVGALAGAIVESIITGIFSVLFTLMLTRIYVQLSGRESVERPGAEAS
jgi:uncharacterized membrane protein YhdT